MINGQFDGSQSYWPTIGGPVAKITASTCHFPSDLEKEQRSLFAFGVKLGVFFKVSLNVGGSGPGRTVEIRSANICENMRLCLLKKKTGGKTSAAIAVDLGRL